MDEQQLNALVDKVYALVVAKLSASLTPNTEEKPVATEAPAQLPDNFDAPAPDQTQQQAEPRLEGFVKHLMTSPVGVELVEGSKNIIYAKKVDTTDILTNVTLEGKDYGIPKNMPLDLVIGDKTYADLVFDIIQSDEEKIVIGKSIIEA